MRPSLRLKRVKKKQKIIAEQKFNVEGEEGKDESVSVSVESLK